jgi:hypothetical protein
VNLYCENLTDATPARASGALTISGVSSFPNTTGKMYVGGRNVPARKAVKHIDEARITKRALALSELLYPLTISADSDADGLLDTWEIAYFGDLTTTDGTGDEDDDGFNDDGEFHAGTNPTIIPRRFLKSPEWIQLISLA